ncbi:hypothetical protein [Desulfosporosinus sp.]|uniref:hypothetical protein n=1 Tax=Desulfosporosinus sp. TaxID=157907 RepID=UPI0025C67F89|nr:hypothetical protein [Desulfosporosinus sp.]MBC2721818.1 hypothetical protein [Desulfosporosinus sp.]MBC2726278.1 hypothetical protein [Desulfosporosinus sp.]
MAVIIAGTVECAYCGKERSPKDMKIGHVFILKRKWSERKQKEVSYAFKQKDWYCKDGCHPDDRHGSET